ncbi:hypothetical protein PLICRDRAFT_38116 [Plicaturopsis crispa FD-325 SS-3]|nr:hypothetical protein PLICRDRAFT_38116 [Plicaturopsis crispa FD-325 SS-3]
MDNIDLSEPLENPFDAYDDPGFTVDDPKERAVTVYRHVWDAFYHWEQEECRQVIASHIRNIPKSSSASGSHELVAAPVSGLQDHMDVDSDPEALIQITAWDASGQPSQSEHSCVDIVITTNFPSHPKYESCTPIVKSITHDNDREAVLPFIPYADEPGFDEGRQIEFSSFYDHFGWTYDFDDPDLETIQIETARRLHFRHGFTIRDIDALKILHPLHVTSEQGVIWASMQRDNLQWPGVLPWPSSVLSPFNDTSPGFYQCDVADLQVRVNRALRDFCPLRNCVESSCSTHLKVEYPSISAVKPVLTNDYLVLSEGSPCGEDCYRHIVADETFMNSVHWNSIEQDNFMTILQMMPDMWPCHLATLCQKPCDQVFVQRTRVLSDESIIQTIANTALVPEKKKIKMKYEDKEAKFTPVTPCHHKGPCYNYAQCQCFKNKQHCSFNCRCNMDCPIRWQGCTCHKSKLSCHSKKCPCFKAQRECDPDLCTSCDARSTAKSKSSKGCQNIKLQRGSSHVLEIKRGAFGLGAYATRKIHPAELVGEYVGELVEHDEARGEIYLYNGRNYLFGLNSTYSSDAAQAGNETRYLNHAPGSAANCHALNFFVNNEHRIGLFAARTICSGEELLLDYGEGYWVNHQPEDNL